MPHTCLLLFIFSAFKIIQVKDVIMYENIWGGGGVGEREKTKLLWIPLRGALKQDFWKYLGFCPNKITMWFWFKNLGWSDYPPPPPLVGTKSKFFRNYFMRASLMEKCRLKEAYQQKVLRPKDWRSRWARTLSGLRSQVLKAESRSWHIRPNQLRDRSGMISLKRFGISRFVGVLTS